MLLSWIYLGPAQGPDQSYNSTAPQLQWDGESVHINLLKFQHLFSFVPSESACSEVPD